MAEHGKRAVGVDYLRSYPAHIVPTALAQGLLYRHAVLKMDIGIAYADRHQTEYQKDAQVADGHNTAIDLDIEPPT